MLRLLLPLLMLADCLADLWIPTDSAHLLLTDSACLTDSTHPITEPARRTNSSHLLTDSVHVTDFAHRTDSAHRTDPLHLADFAHLATDSAYLTDCEVAKEAMAGTP